MLVLLGANRIASDFIDEDVAHIGLELAKGNADAKPLLDIILEYST